MVGADVTARAHRNALAPREKRVAVLALQGDDLREGIDHAAVLQVLERKDRA